MRIKAQKSKKKFILILRKDMSHDIVTLLHEYLTILRQHSLNDKHCGVQARIVLDILKKIQSKQH